MDLVEVCSIPRALVSQLAEQFSPPAIGNPFSKVVVRQHPFHIQVFGADDLVFVNQPPTEFVQEILASVRYLFVLAGNAQPHLFSIV